MSDIKSLETELIEFEEAVLNKNAGYEEKKNLMMAERLHYEEDLMKEVTDGIGVKEEVCMNLRERDT